VKVFQTLYGDIPIGRADVREQECASVDLRRVTGGVPTLDESKVCPPGTFTLSLFGVVPGEMPVGEVRLLIDGAEVALVGHLTGRPNVTEITPDHLTACNEDGYRRALLGFIKGAA